MRLGPTYVCENLRLVMCLDIFTRAQGGGKERESTKIHRKPRTELTHNLFLLPYKCPQIE